MNRNLSKYLSGVCLISIFFLVGCSDDTVTKSGLNEIGKFYLDKIMTENPGARYEVVLDKKFGKEDGIYYSASGYSLKLIVNSMVVLSNNIDSLRKLGIYYESTSYNANMELGLLGIVVKCDSLDSIKIVTDSVIAMESLVLSQCNLTHLPPEIGKVRTKVLDIGWNKLASIPIEILGMDSVPQPYDSLNILIYGPSQWSSQQVFDTLPEWAKNFLNKH